MPQTVNERLTVSIRPWADGDLSLLRALMGDPAMTEHLGGPEPDDKIRSRHERYRAIGGTGTGRMFAITVGPDAVPVGSVGYWAKEWRGEPAWETGWSVIPAYQGKGIARRAAALVLQRAADEGTHRFILAYPGVANAASNAVCARLGMELVEAAEFEYPPGNWMTCNVWRLDLGAPDAPEGYADSHGSA